MIITKTSEKILIWMTRNNITGQKIAEEIGVTRQAVSKKINNNIFTHSDMLALKRLGFKD